MELPYNQVPHAVTELLLLMAQAKQAEGIRLDSFPLLESGYAALKLVRLAYLSHGASRGGFIQPAAATLHVCCLRRCCMRHHHPVIMLTSHIYRVFNHHLYNSCWGCDARLAQPAH